MSRAPSPHGVAPRASTRSQSSPASSAMHEQLDALLARVAGAVDHAGDAVDLALRERERRRLGEPEPLERARPLHGDQRRTRRRRRGRPSRDLALLQPLEVDVRVRRVDDQQEPARVELVDDQVVDDPAALVRQQRVLRLADARSGRGRSRAATARSSLRARPLDLELAHVRDVEHAASLAHGAVLRRSRPRTARASPSRRTAPCARRARRGARRAASGGASASRRMLPRAGSLPSATACYESRRNEGTSSTSSGMSKPPLRRRARGRRARGSGARGARALLGGRRPPAARRCVAEARRDHRHAQLVAHASRR